MWPGHVSVMFTQTSSKQTNTEQMEWCHHKTQGPVFVIMLFRIAAWQTPSKRSEESAVRGMHLVHNLQIQSVKCHWNIAKLLRPLSNIVPVHVLTEWPTNQTQWPMEVSSKCNITLKYPAIAGALIEALETAAYLSFSEAGKESSERAFLDVWTKGTENLLPFTSFWWHSETFLALFRNQRHCLEDLRTDFHLLWVSRPLPHRPLGDAGSREGGSCRWHPGEWWCLGQERGWYRPGFPPFRGHRDSDSRTELPSSARTEFVFGGWWRRVPPRHIPAECLLIPHGAFRWRRGDR